MDVGKLTRSSQAPDHWVQTTRFSLNTHEDFIKRAVVEMHLIPGQAADGGIETIPLNPLALVETISEYDFDSGQVDGLFVNITDRPQGVKWPVANYASALHLVKLEQAQHVELGLRLIGLRSGIIVKKVVEDNRPNKASEHAEIKLANLDVLASLGTALHVTSEGWWGGTDEFRLLTASTPMVKQVLVNLNDPVLETEWNLDKKLPSATIVGYWSKLQLQYGMELKDIPPVSSPVDTAFKASLSLLTGNVFAYGPEASRFGAQLVLQRDADFVWFTVDNANDLAVSGNVQGSCESAGCPIFGQLSATSGGNFTCKFTRETHKQHIEIPGWFTTMVEDTAERVGFSDVLVVVEPYEKAANDARVRVKNAIVRGSQALPNAIWSLRYHGLTTRIPLAVYAVVG